MPRIAVVVPLYNHAAYIGAALQSVTSQTRPADRIVVVDDGSTDGSAQVVERLGLPQIELIRQANSGAHEALNRGVEAVSDCDWVAILNSDDAFASRRLERALAVLESRPTVELLCTRLHLIDGSGMALSAESPKVRRAEKIWSLVQMAEDPLLPLAVSNYAKTTSNFVVHRDFLRRHPFGPYRFVHDYHLMLVAALEEKLAVLPEDLLAYRVHASNTIKAEGRSPVAEETLRMHLDVLASQAGALRESPVLRRRWRLYLQRLLGNHTDFRGELFVQVMAEMLAVHPGEALSGLAAHAPELEAKPEKLPEAV